MPINVAIVGAGPYGLSVAATLRAANVSYRVFGRPMHTWRSAMPSAMHLKSDGFASNLCVPVAGSELGDFCRARKVPYGDENVLVPLTTFVDYGLHFQAQHVPDLDQRNVVRIGRVADGYSIELDDGTQLTARRVVLAVGVTHFAYIPKVLSGLPAEYLTHSSAHTDFSRFAGKNVTVIGAGSSAVELATGLDAAGAKARLLIRGDEIRFNTAPDTKERSLWQRIRHPRTGLGPGMTSWLCCKFPQLYRLLPGTKRMKVLRAHLGPKSQYHLRERIESNVEVVLRHELERCAVAGNQVELHCRDRSSGKAVTIRTDHVIAATGYAGDIERLSFVAPELRAGIERYEGYPVLSSNFESSQPGLYFVGLAAAGTFGPLMRFVYGAGYAVRRLGAHLA